MKFTTVSIKEIQADKTHRLDAGYWIRKKGEWQKDGKKLKKLQASSCKRHETNTIK